MPPDLLLILIISINAIKSRKSIMNFFNENAFSVVTIWHQLWATFWIKIFLFQTVKTFRSKLSKISLFKLSKISFPNCQIFPFETIKISLFQTVKISLSKLSKFSIPNCQNFLFETVAKSQTRPNKKRLKSATSRYQNPGKINRIHLNIEDPWNNSIYFFHFTKKIYWNMRSNFWWKAKLIWIIF